ncbi:MAG: mandelate racemase/muconate lactonizing enzyme family protein, partial [Alphaproteobacteria bacterium]|nr:mandelate racemase/muconate lactonizing enzyme family protein [Alphaproteobacteria bacterium]
EELADNILGMNPLMPEMLDVKMDGLLKGHNYVKSAIDVACWDLKARLLNVPLYMLLGGLYQSELPLYFSISSAGPEEMLAACEKARGEGYKQFQIKCDGNVDLDILRIKSICETALPGEIFIADANQGWAQHEAIKLVKALCDVDVYIEQPCPDLEGCLVLRAKSNHPIKLDETIDSVEAVLRAASVGALDVACLKVSKVGGLTKAKQVRDICVNRNLSMTIEDSWGSDIVTATLAHLAASTPEKYVLNCSDLNRYMSGHVAFGAPIAQNGKLCLGEEVGHGAIPDFDTLGAPVFSAYL